MAAQSKNQRWRRGHCILLPCVNTNNGGGAAILLESELNSNGQLTVSSRVDSSLKDGWWSKGEGAGQPAMILCGDNTTYGTRQSTGVHHPTTTINRQA